MSVTVEDALASAKEQFRDVLRNPLGSPPPPGAPTGPVDREVSVRHPCDQLYEFRAERALRRGASQR